MLLSFAWLKELVPYTGTVATLCSALTQRGLEIEKCETPFLYMQDVYVGLVQECAPHPNAASLFVCKVLVGEELLTIVCGAHNVCAGIKVPVALEGAMLPGELRIQTRTLRGIESQGMICSECELELHTDTTRGIWILPEDAPIGVSLYDYLQLEDTIIEVSVTPNRSDCLSVLGIAREVAMAFSLPLTLPSIEYPKEPDCEDTYSISVTQQGTSELERAGISYVQSYCLQLVQNIVQIDTPIAMRLRLQSVGIRPISLIVDILNYVMLEVGQPLHAYDAEDVHENTLCVSSINEETQLTLLDGTVRDIPAGSIAITNGDAIVALAGIMGTSAAIVKKSTSKVLIEAACFDAVSIRKTSKAMGLSTQASYRFERGVDPTMCQFAIERALALLAKYTTLQVSSTLHEYKAYAVRTPLLFRPDKVRDILGTAISDDTIETVLVHANCVIEKCTFFWKITPPSYRLDLTQEVDLVTEVARSVGMDTLPQLLPAIQINPSLLSEDTQYKNSVQTKNYMARCGLQEIISYSFLSKTLLEELGLTKQSVSILNPISEEYNVLRTRLLPSLLSAMQKNCHKGNVSCALFEVGSIFLSTHEGVATHVDERPVLGILLHGRKDSFVYGASDEEWTYQDIKGIVETFVCKNLGLQCTYTQEENTLYLPCVGIYAEGQKLGIMGRVEPELAERFDARADVWYAELRLPLLYDISAKKPLLYKPFSVYPSITRDVTYCYKQATCKVGTIIDTIEAMNLPLLDSLYCCDIYLPEDADEVRATIRMVFRDSTRTLTDQEADTIRDTIVENVKTQLRIWV